MRDTELPPADSRPAKTWQLNIDVGDKNWKESAKALAEALKKLEGVLAVTFKEDKPGVLDISVKADQLLVKNVVEKAVKNAGYTYKNVAEVKARQPAEEKPTPAQG
ncbi:MAG: hypothetical protein KF696_14975 [Planctomycetes bacterium]|nr:hypothetical protein [Planctomycetota bacterium]MCW8135870.1 hypothetical protein [Planctomycetota bacterium]